MGVVIPIGPHLIHLSVGVAVGVAYSGWCGSHLEYMVSQPIYLIVGVEVGVAYSGWVWSFPEDCPIAPVSVTQ